MLSGAHRGANTTLRIAPKKQPEHLAERRKMMQLWADYLDKLKAGAEVVPLRGQVA
jgi:hypothetical protein